MSLIPKKRLDLSNVTAWGCAWSDDRQSYRQTFRALRYCAKRIKFERVVMFGFMLPEEPLGDIEFVQIPRLPDFDAFNVFINRTAPKWLTGDFAMAIHDDGMPLNLDFWHKEFLDYDYIGAAWKNGVVGNGGFNIESQKLLQEKMKLPPYEQLVNSADGRGVLASDVYLCYEHRKELESRGIKFAPLDVAMDFSVEQRGGKFRSFGYHGRHCQPEKYAASWKLIEESEKE